MGVFSKETIKTSMNNRSLYKFKNSNPRISNEAVIVSDNPNQSNDSNLNFTKSVLNILCQVETLKKNQNDIYKTALAKQNNAEVKDLLSRIDNITAWVDTHVPADFKMDIPNARKYYNMESRPIGLHNIIHSLNKEILDVNKIGIIMKNISNGYKVEESELLIKEMIDNHTEKREFNIEFINYFSSPTHEIHKNDLLYYLADFKYMATNYANMINNTSSYVISSLEKMCGTVMAAGPYMEYSAEKDNVLVRALVSTKLNHIKDLYSYILKYLYTYQISQEQRFDADITAVKMTIDTMNGKFNDLNYKDNSIDDEIEYGRFLGEATIINEAAGDKINEYLVKITNGIRVAWNKFNQKLDEGRKKITEKFSDKLDELDKRFQKEDPKFSITNYPNYDFTKLDNIKVVPLRYTEMKDSLKSENDFIKKYYTQIPHDEKSSFKDDIKKYVTLSNNELKVTGDVIHDMIGFIREGYDTHRKTIQADIETINKANEEINNISKNMNTDSSNATKVDTKAATTAAPQASTDVTAQQNSAIDISGNYITEADQPPKADPKPQYKDQPDKGGANAGTDKNSFMKDVSVYMKVSTAVMSTKMKVLKDHFMLSVNTLLHAVAPPKKEKEENNAEKK